MYQRTKRRVLTFLSLTLMATLVLLCATLMPKTYSAKAEQLAAPTNVQTDALGFLRWDEVTGAEGYEWSYSTDGTSYISGGTVDGTEADASAAMTAAVKAAKAKGESSATVYFKVNAVGGTETVLPYTFDKYVNYGYSTHDITDVYAPAKSGVTGNFAAGSALYTNELMTFGVTFSADTHTVTNSDGTTSTGKTDFYVGLLGSHLETTVAGNIKYFYKLRFQYHGWTKILTGTSSQQFNQVMDTMTVDETSYFAVGVFDTYNVSDGEIAGETVYFRRTDIVNGKPVVVYSTGIAADGSKGPNPINEASQTFFTTTEAADYPTTLEDTTKKSKNHTIANNSSDMDGDTILTGTLPKDAFAIYSSTDSNIKTTSGKIPTSSGVETPTMAHYDNVTGQVKWNSVDEAVKYEWTYVGSNDGWQETENEYISAEDVAAAIQNAKANGHIRFAVRAVNNNGGASQTQYVGLDLTAFYRNNSTLKDISDIKTELQDPNVTMKDCNGYIYVEKAVYQNEFIENSFVFNTDDSAANRLAISLHSRSWGSWNGWYTISIYSNGDMTIGRDSQQGASTNGRFWARRLKAFALELDKKYIATCGVEDLVDQQGNKVADRVTVKISEEVDGARKVLAIVSYDNYEYNWGDMSIDYSGFIKYTFLSGSTDFKTTSVVSCASLVRDITYVTPDGVSHENPATYTANGDTVTFADPTAVPTGYAFDGWYSDVNCTETIANTDGKVKDLTVYAKLKQLYTVTVIDKDNNQTKNYVENGVFTLPDYSASGVIGYDVNGELYEKGEQIDVTGDTTATEVYLNLVMVDGAQVRLSSAGEYYGGLRFKVTVNSEVLTKYAAQIKLFGMILPTDLVVDDFDGVGETPDEVELTNPSAKDENVYYVTLGSVLYTNYNRAFSARAYAVITYANGEKTIYTEYLKDENSRSVYEVASKASASDTETADAKAVLQNYLSYTVNIVENGDTYSVATTQDGLTANVTREYSVNADNTVTLTNIPEKLYKVLEKTPYVPVTVWYADNTSKRIIVKVTAPTWDATSKTATATTLVID